MQRHHYLGLPRSWGRLLRHVAEVQGRWLALLLWQPCALLCAVRDRWIGWARPLQFQRLHLIVNNTRFVVLPEARVAHLASRVLGQSLRRLAADWAAHHGVRPLLAETFVDPARFQGTCYRAANWQYLGLTRGFARQRAAGSRYRYHGSPKQVWVYGLHPRARQWLRDPVPHPEWSHAMSTVHLSDLEMEQLHQTLRRIPDPRGGRRRLHRLSTVLTIAIAATLAGARGYLAIAEFAAALSQTQLKRLRAYYSRRQQRFVAPTEPTIRRVLQRVDPEALEQAFSAWLMQHTEHEPLAVDGKSLRGARDDHSPLPHLLAALLHRQGTVLAQRAVDPDSNEIPALRPLLEPLDIQGRVVTADALHAQRETARFLVEDKQAHYLFTVKDNQPTLREALEATDWSAFPPCSAGR